MDDLEFIVTSDGSHTLRNRRLNETYHSIHGALRESEYVFVSNGLKFFHQAHPGGSISILEVGFGTGLNAWLTLLFARDNNVPVRYVTLEPFPLEEQIWSRLNYVQDDKAMFESLHRAPWGESVEMHSTFAFKKLKSSLLDLDTSDTFDVIYFDAFAPSIQPALWQLEALKKATDRLNPEGVFVTYSAKGQLKRDLKALGLNVETLAGPPGKKEMVRASRGVGQSPRG
jgi:tRNA U34 5-methylaminomethyl-2-thiouridine-forming methyltransferase MnmC